MPTLVGVALAVSLAAMVSCGARTELTHPELCDREGLRRACRGVCGIGEQVCRDGYWNPCEVAPTTAPCSNDCGAGERTCTDGAWGECVVPVGERPCSDDCGDGVEQCLEGVWGECVVPPVDKPCFTACGDGVEHCENGVWQPCNAPKPIPPTLTATVRDFNDTHPDFEKTSGDDRGIVGETLGPDDKPIYAGGSGTLTTTGALNFDQWYRDTPGVNLTTQIDLPFTTVAAKPDQFQYAKSDFFPIDGQLYGNQGRLHNYHFTLEVATQFRYVGGETFTFSGDDDVWVFVNRQLAIDLGGVHSRETATVNLDDQRARFGIEVGGTYPLHVFFAERHTIASDFEVETEIGTEPSCP